MVYEEIIAVYSEILTKHINTLWRQNVESLSVKSGGTKKINFKELKERLWRMEVTDKSNVQFYFQFWYNFRL